MAQATQGLATEVPTREQIQQVGTLLRKVQLQGFSAPDLAARCSRKRLLVGFGGQRETH